MRNTEDVITAVYVMNTSLVAIYNYYISKINCKNEIHTIITKYINYGIHQLRIIFMLCSSINYIR